MDEARLRQEELELDRIRTRIRRTKIRRTRTGKGVPRLEAKYVQYYSATYNQQVSAELALPE